MYAVIFRAQSAVQDEEYLSTANRLRDLAFDEYGCMEFISLEQDGLEIAISYWPDEEHILRWKENTEHMMAQDMGKQE